MEVSEFTEIIPENFVEAGYNSLKDIINYCLSEEIIISKIDWGDFEDEVELEANIESCIPEPIRLLNNGDEVPVFGVDASNIDLGETREGFLCAIRGCIVWRKEKEYRYIRHGPFIFHITETNRQFLYNALRQKCFDVGERVGAPLPERMPEYIRNILERWLQKNLCESCQGSIILWDGSLTTRTPNSPISLLHTLLKSAREEENIVLAFSKKTSISAFGRRLSDLIDDWRVPCLLDIDDFIRLQYGKSLRFFGRIYAVKLTPGALSFRLDIDRRIPSKERVNAVESLICSDLIVDSYPETLRLAHVLSRFSATEVIAMQRYVAENYDLKIIRRPDVRQILFGPYGGFSSNQAWG